MNYDDEIKALKIKTAELEKKYELEKAINDKILKNMAELTKIVKTFNGDIECLKESKKPLLKKILNRE